MKIKTLFPVVPVPVVFSLLTSKNEAGNYDPISDTITICSSLKIPLCRDIVYLHELFHATGNQSRSFRRRRLVQHFGLKAYRVEECIAEICTLIALLKLGELNQYTTLVMEDGLKKYYDGDIYIPWREVIAALNCFAGEGVEFDAEKKEIREYLSSKFAIKIKDSYEWNNH